MMLPYDCFVLSLKSPLKLVTSKAITSSFVSLRYRDYLTHLYAGPYKDLVGRGFEAKSLRSFMLVCKSEFDFNFFLRAREPPIGDLGAISPLMWALFICKLLSIL